MIAVITSGSGFVGTERYVEDKESRNHKIVRELDYNGVDVRIGLNGELDADPDRIASSFCWQAMTNTRVSKPVGHTSLSFHPKEGGRMTDDLMTRIALDYMEAMGIRNTQWHIVRHCEKEHPHCHIIWNRVDCDGNKIDDSFERQRSVKVCRDLTIKYALTWGEHKSKSKCKVNDPVEQERYAICKAVTAAIRRCCELEDLKHELIKVGIITEIRRDTSGNPTGISFSRNGKRFKGSDLDRSLSVANIRKQLDGEDVVKTMTEYQTPSPSASICLADFIPEGTSRSQEKDPADKEKLDKFKKKGQQKI